MINPLDAIRVQYELEILQKTIRDSQIANLSALILFCGVLIGMLVRDIRKK